MRHPEPERIGAYADGELAPEEARALESHLESCTECMRELANVRAVGGAMRTMMDGAPRTSVWARVERRIGRPLGWILVAAGTAVLAVLALAEWFREGALTAEWLATTAVGVGVALLAVGIGYEQYREWRTSPYKDIEK